MSHKGTKGRRRGGGDHAEEHVNHERWMVSYADMLTLLFVLFVVLFAMSTVDQKKFEELAGSLADVFGASGAAFSGQRAPMDGSSSDGAALPLVSGADPHLEDDALSKPTSAEEAAARAAVAAKERAKASADAQAAIREVKNLREIQARIQAALRKAKMDKNVYFAINERGLVVTVVSSDVVFAGDRAELRPGGRKIIHAIGPQLAGLPNDIAVDGHTNQLNVATVNYASGWELSTARASVTVRALIGEDIAEKRLTAAGYADTRPLIDPKDPRSVTMNRRVDVVVLSTLTAEQRSLLPTIAETA